MQVPSPSAREAAAMYGTTVAVFLVILVAALQGSAPPESLFPYHIPLDPEGTLELAWNVSYAQETVHFRLLVRELRAGVLFGMSDRGEMENADLAVLWTDGDSAYFGVSLPSILSLAPPSSTSPPGPRVPSSPVWRKSMRNRGSPSRGPWRHPQLQDGHSRRAQPQGRTGSRRSVSAPHPPRVRPHSLTHTTISGRPHPHT